MTTEKRLIDSNALSEAIRGICKGIKRPMAVELACLVMIADAPAVDAVEVVHSQWDSVFYESNRTLASYSHICQICKYFYRDIRFKGYNYCPNCGAKMDGGADNEKR